METGHARLDSLDGAIRALSLGPRSSASATPAAICHSIFLSTSTS
jgi:hypothetical protein